jgi:hypothetical protein
MPRRLLPLLLLAATGIATILAATGSVAAYASRIAATGSLKGSSCAHPYKVELKKPRVSPVSKLLGDTFYATRQYHLLPSSNPRVERRSYSWGGKHGTHVCEFHVWVTERYRIGETALFEKKPVLRGTPIQSRKPKGGRNVVVQMATECGRFVCPEEREGLIEVHEILTTAR